MSSRLTRLLQNLRAALSDLMSDSQTVGSVLSEIEDEGLSVYLVVDDPTSGEEPKALRLIPDPASAEDSQPDFRIDQTDLTILKGMGIDPTRTLRRRRRARRR